MYTYGPLFNLLFGLKKKKSILVEEYFRDKLKYIGNGPTLLGLYIFSHFSQRE